MLQAVQDAGIVPFPSIAHDALQNVDAVFRGVGDSLPSTVILDYSYGVAAYQAWRSESSDGFDQMEAYRDKHYAHIPPRSRASPDDIYDTDVTSGPDDPKDSDYKPRKRGLEETMDELNMVLMYINGITPEMAAERRQKEIEREERVAQEGSRSKVMEWRNHLDVY